MALWIKRKKLKKRNEHEQSPGTVKNRKECYNTSNELNCSE
jgi:hypothetical protein